MGWNPLFSVSGTATTSGQIISPPAEHRHFAAHLVFDLERPFTALADDVSVEAEGIAIGSDVPHTILSEAPVFAVFIDELMPLSRCVKHALLRG